MDKLLFCFAVCCAVTYVSCQVDGVDLCTESLDQCYDDEVQEILRGIQNRFHSDVGALCSDLRKANLSRCASTTETCGAQNPWKYPVTFFIEGLCTEENIRQFSTPLVPADQCFHINFTFACLVNRVDNYNTLTEFIRSHKNNETCGHLIRSVSDCVTATFTACPNPEKLRPLLQALLALAHHTLTVTGCDVQALSSGADTDTMARQSECDIQMTWMQSCVQTITNPTTVANHLLEKVYLTHDGSVQEFCKDYKDVLDCKRNLTTGHCYSEDTRDALARNIYAFSKARDLLCDDNAKNLSAFKDALTSHKCHFNEDILENCAREFVHTVTTMEAFEDYAIRAFTEQLNCIRKEIETCKAVPIQNLSASFLNAAAAAFRAATNRTTASDAAMHLMSIYSVITLLVATGLSTLRF